MSKGTLGQVVKRAISDAGFRHQLQSDPEGALKGFDLTSDERAALRSGDASKLSALGVDQRMSKAFLLGEGAAAVSRHGTGSDLAMGANIPDGGEPLISDALISGGGGRANDALIGDAGGSVRGAVTDGSRLGQVNAAFEGGDSAAPRAAIRDSHDNVRAAFPDGTAAGVSVIRDSHDSVRAAVSDTASREGSAYITADERGNDVVAGGSAGGQSSLDVSGQMRGSAFVTADEAGRDVSARGTQDYGQQTSLDISGSTRDASVISGDVAGRQGDAFITADEAGRDVSARASDVGGRQGDAFITADEMGNDTTAAVRAPDPDTALTQSGSADDAAMANPEGYERPDPTA